MNLIEQIQRENPSFMPKEQAAIKAGISLETVNAAEDRVYFDGMYGPISPIEWEEQDGRKPYTVTEALHILEKIADNVDDYFDNEYETMPSVDSRDIVKAMWPWLVEIYGSFPF